MCFVFRVKAKSEANYGIYPLKLTRQAGSTSNSLAPFFLYSITPKLSKFEGEKF
jgi:hypothetical protein